MSESLSSSKEPWLLKLKLQEKQEQKLLLQRVNIKLAGQNNEDLHRKLGIFILLIVSDFHMQKKNYLTHLY